MTLFNFGKKKKRRKHLLVLVTVAVRHRKRQRLQTIVVLKQGMVYLCIKVLGDGCKNCHDLLENTKEAVKVMGLSVEVEYVTDMQKIMEYGVMSMPALVVNEKVVSMGKVLKVTDVEKIFHKLGF